LVNDYQLYDPPTNMTSYYSSGFEALFLRKIGESQTSEFKICTGYTRISYIRRFDDLSIDPDSNFNNKISQILIGDPLGHSIEERKSIEKRFGGDALFCNQLKFNKRKKAFKPIIHSKIIIGFDEYKNPIWAMIGSNNFTNNGMRDKNEESMLFVDQPSILAKISLHFNEMKKICAGLRSLNLDRITGTQIDGGYSMVLKSERNQAIDPICVIQVLVEDTHELYAAKTADSILVDLIGSSDLLDLISDGKFRPFIVIFVDNVKIEKSENVGVRYGITRASVDINRGAEAYTGSPDGYVRYFSKAIADFSMKRVFDPHNNHTQDIPFKNRALARDFDTISGDKKKKEKMAKIINQFLDVSDKFQLQKAYSFVSSDKKSPNGKVPRALLNSIEDNQILFVSELVEKIQTNHFDSLEGKMGYIDSGDLTGKQAHEKENYYLKSEVFEEVSLGLDEMKKEFGGEYSSIIKSALDFSEREVSLVDFSRTVY
jgi:hypothetical protein